MWHTGAVPLLPRCLKGLQLSNSLAQVVVFTLVVQSGLPAKISVAGVNCSLPSGEWPPLPLVLRAAES